MTELLGQERGGLQEEPELRLPSLVTRRQRRARKSPCPICKIPDTSPPPLDLLNTFVALQTETQVSFAILIPVWIAAKL